MQGQLAIAVFVLLGSAFVVAALLFSLIFQHRTKGEEKYGPYECGSDPVGPPWVQFKIGYYVYALLFVVFDIETAFLYPWAVAYGTLGPFVLAEMALFVAILAAGLAFAWREGALSWR